MKNEGYSKEKKDLSIHLKYALTISEASIYFGIGIVKLRFIIQNNPDADFYIMNGTKVLIKRVKFENWLDLTDSI